MKVKALIKIRAFAQEASSKEPVGPSIGVYGIPIMEFCEKFNSATLDFERGTKVHTVVFYYGNQKYDFIVKLPDLNFFIKRIISSCVNEEIKWISKPGYINLKSKNDYALYVTLYMLYEVLNYSLVTNNVIFDDMDFKELFRKMTHSIFSMGYFIYN